MHSVRSGGSQSDQQGPVLVEHQYNGSNWSLGIAFRPPKLCAHWLVRGGNLTLIKVTFLTPPSGMPAVAENKKKYKDTMYGAITAAGEQFPPVVFTSDRNDAGHSSARFFVKYLERVKGPGNHSTEVWWDSVGQDNLGEDDELWLDNLKSHHSKTFLEEVRSNGVTIRYYPKYAGSILNPMDNTFWAAFRASYYRESREDHGQMLDAIESWFYRPTEDVIRRYWHHCGYTSDEKPEAVVERLLGEGYHPKDDKHQAEHDAMLSSYIIWSANRKLLRRGSLPQSAPQSLGFSGLDGVYWTAFRRRDGL